jgi:hypothetical protein
MPAFETKLTVVTSLLAALVLLLASGAQAQVRFDDPSWPTKATRIDNLDVPGVGTFNVIFELSDAEGLFGAFPGDGVQLPPFSNSAEVEAATDAAITALNQFDATGVGKVDGLPEYLGYNVADVSVIQGPFESLSAFGGVRNGPTFFSLGANSFDWAGEEIVYAIYTDTSVSTAEISLSPSRLTPAVQVGDNAPDQMFTVRNSGGGTLDYTITGDANWLSLDPTSGTSDGEADSITVRYDTDLLALGTYSATITVSDLNASNDPQTIDVLLIVTDLPAISLSVTSLEPVTPVGEDAPQDSFTVTNSGGQILSYEVTKDELWLSVDPPSGNLMNAQMDTITVTYTTSGLSAGTYTATIVVRDEGAANLFQEIEVTLDVGGPVISLSPSILIPAVLQGDDAPDQTFQVSNGGSGTINYTIEGDANWLSLSPTSGTSTGDIDLITVSFDTQALDLGPYLGTITVSDPNASNNPQTIDVLLIVTDLPAISLSLSLLAPQTVVGGDAPQDSFTVANSGGQILNYTFLYDADWLSVDPGSGTSTGEADTITVSYTTSALPEGTHETTIFVSDPRAANNSQAIDVILTVPEPNAELGVLVALVSLGLLARGRRSNVRCRAGHAGARWRRPEGAS